jgi:MFS family permease
MFPAMPSIWFCFPLRLALGVAAETMLVMSETWLNQLSDDSSRTRTIAIYAAALSLGFALGPVILTAVGTEGQAPFLIAGGMALVALLSIAMPWVRAPVFERPSHPNPLRYLGLAPVALLATLVNAALETAGMSFLPLYAMRVGWDERSATLLLSVLLLGAIVMQLPIGWLGDRVDRRKLVIGLGMASTVGALAWPYVIGSPALAYALLFVWGGLFVGIYTVMMSLVGSRFRRSRIDLCRDVGGVGSRGLRRPQHSRHLHEPCDAWPALFRDDHVRRLHDPGRSSEKRHVTKAQAILPRKNMTGHGIKGKTDHRRRRRDLRRAVEILEDDSLRHQPEEDQFRWMAIMPLTKATRYSSIFVSSLG